MANLGPLTTVYKPSGTGCHSTHIGVVAGTITIKQHGTVSGCFPSNYNPLPGYYYSPGICQQGYDYACTGDIGLAGVTGDTCCPTGFTCLPNLHDTDSNPCASIFTSNSTLTVDILSYTNGWPNKVGVTTTIYRAGCTVFAKGLAVQRAGSDSEWNTTPTEATSTESTSRTVNTASNIPSSKSDQPSSGISTNATVSIFVTVGIVSLLLIIGLSITAYQCGKRRGSRKEPESSDTQLEEAEIKQWGPAHEIEEQRTAQELRTVRDPAELSV